MSQVEVVDDRDPRVQYSGIWQLAGVNEEYNTTTHGTFTAGSRVTFNFKGSSVEVFGTISNSPPYTDAPISFYSLDGAPSQTYNPAFPDKIYYRISFFKSAVLEDKQHVLVITSTVANSAFWLDYFKITSNGLSHLTPAPTPPAPPPPPSSSRTPSTHATPTTIDFPTSSFAPSSSSSIPRDLLQTTRNLPSPSSSTTNEIILYPTSSTPTNLSEISPSTSALPKKKIVPMGAIVGGVIGGVIMILLICLAFVCYRRRERPQRVVSRYSIQPDRSSFGTHQPSHSVNWERENTRFIGDVSPFMGHLGSGSETGTGSSSDGISNYGEPVVPQDTMTFPYSVTASGKTRRLEGEENLYHPGIADIPPKYS